LAFFKNIVKCSLTLKSEKMWMVTIYFSAFGIRVHSNSNKAVSIGRRAKRPSHGDVQLLSFGWLQRQHSVCSDRYHVQLVSMKLKVDPLILQWNTIDFLLVLVQPWFLERWDFINNINFKINLPEFKVPECLEWGCIPNHLARLLLKIKHGVDTKLSRGDFLLHRFWAANVISVSSQPCAIERPVLTILVWTPKFWCRNHVISMRKPSPMWWKTKTPSFIFFW